ncbi:MAG: hypothetical protein SOU80_01015 [Alphaproteobacteria bacterium]|nr:hypothetical protein [Alphaproteobacteria bacterium]
MVAMVVVLTSCQEQEYTFPLDNGMVTLRTASDLSPKQLEAIQKEIEDVIANKAMTEAMTTKELKKSLNTIIRKNAETNIFSYTLDYGTGKNKIRMSVEEPIDGKEMFCIAGICLFILLCIFIPKVRIE